MSYVLVQDVAIALDDFDVVVHAGPVVMRILDLKVRKGQVELVPPRSGEGPGAIPVVWIRLGKPRTLHHTVKLVLDHVIAD